MHFQRNVTLLLGRMELVVVELDTGAELIAMECAELAGAELIDGTYLGSGATGGWSIAAMGDANTGRAGRGGSGGSGAGEQLW